MQQEETRNSKNNALAANISHNLASAVKNNVMMNKPRVAVTVPQVSQARCRPYNDPDNIFFVPVRGLASFQQVNKFAEFLDLTEAHDGECYTDSVQTLRTERNKLVQSSNPSLNIQSLSSSEILAPSPAKRVCVAPSSRVASNNISIRPPVQPRYIVPIMPKPEQRSGKGLLMSGSVGVRPLRAPRATIILPPRAPLGKIKLHNTCSRYRQHNREIL